MKPCIAGGGSRAIALSPSTGAHFGALGRALRDQGKFQEAIAAHRRAMELDPAAAVNCMNLGNVLGQVAVSVDVTECRGIDQVDVAFDQFRERIPGIGMGKVAQQFVVGSHFHLTYSTRQT